MGVEDKQLAVQVRREVVRRNLDASRLVLSCAKGAVELSGRLVPAVGTMGIDVEQELHIVRERAMRMPGCRDVTWKYLMFK